MKIDRSQDSELGNFKLIPDKGKKLRSFIDFESKLLVVTESPVDTKNLPHLKAIPTQQYIIDTEIGNVLKPSEWREYFNYDKFEIVSEDQKLKEIVQRIHEPERNTDSIKYTLIDNENSETIFTNGTSIAFNDKPRESSIKSYYEQLESQKKFLKSLDLGKYPINNYNKYINEIKEHDLIIQYFSEEEVFELKFEQGRFNLKSSNKPKNIQGWKSIKSKTIKSFKTLDDFWEYLVANTNNLISLFRKQNLWFTKYQLRIKSLPIEKFIIDEHNKLVQNRIVPYATYKDLHNWMNINYNQELEKNVYWQFCSNCRDRVYYNPRYPNHACRKCVNQIRDNKGNELNYRDSHELKYIDSKFKLILKETNEEVKIFINEIEYFASEARFGGIVHQLKE